MKQVLCFLLVLTCSSGMAQNQGFLDLLEYEGSLDQIPPSLQKTYLPIDYEGSGLMIGEGNYPYIYLQDTRRVGERTYLICNISPGHAKCSGSLIAAFTHTGKFLQHELYAIDCDQDEFDPVIEVSESAFLNDTIIEIKHGEIDNGDAPELEGVKEEDLQEAYYYAYVILGKNQLSAIGADPPGEDEPEEAIMRHKILRAKDLRNLSKKDLRIKRNSIYALHGYTFKSADLQTYFSKKSWYKQSKKSEVEVFEGMNPIEKINIRILKEKEDAG